MIARLISDLPEIYQPIYGHPELSGQVSRPCQDRLKNILQIYSALQSLLGRPLKVLDLGCAQGFFSFALAEHGASVHGVDYLDKNIAVCAALARERPHLSVSFETGRVEEAIWSLKPDQYDLVLGLSVFHHIVYERGADEVRVLLSQAARRSGVLVIEVALREEPLYWGPSQPQDPRVLLDDIAFVHEVARHETHLSPIPRPLYVASNQYWVLDDRARKFDTWSEDPHALAQGTHEGSRRYFFSVDTIVKLYRFDHPRRGAYNKAEFTRERLFLTNPPSDFPILRCHILGENGTEGWLALERLPGKLLLDLLRDGADIDCRRVLLAILEQIATLEAAGCYHSDIRTWNILITDDGAVHLIDYGSISAEAEDCVWPRNPFLAFFIFVREVATGVIDDTDTLRTISISPYGLPQPYRAWATSLWQRPLHEWSFRLMHDTLKNMGSEEIEKAPERPADVWMKAIEEAVQTQKLLIKHIGHKARHAEERATHAEATARQAEAQAQQAEATARHAEERATHAEATARQAEAQAQQAEATARHAEERATHAEATARQAEAQAQQAEATARHAEERATHAEATARQAEAQAQQAETALHAIYKSCSWRVTRPLRWLSSLVRRGRDKSKQVLKRLAAPVLSRSIRFANACSLSAVKRSGQYVKKSPRLRRLVLRLLRTVPSIEFKLRQIYLGTQLDHQQYYTGGGSHVTQFVDQVESTSGNNDRHVFPASTANGVNAHQRSPLEAHFHAYREKQ